MRWLLALLVVGLLTGGAGIYLVFFTTYLDTAGFTGIAVVVGLLTTSVFLVIPAKLFIILRFTRPASTENRRNPPVTEKTPLN